MSSSWSTFIQISRWCTVQYAKNYILQLCATIINYIGPLHNPDFPVYNCIMSSFVNAMYEQCQDCGQCPYQFCILWSLLLYWIPNWQESHWVSSNCTVVLQADASDNQQKNVKFVNRFKLLQKKNLAYLLSFNQSKFSDLKHKYVLYLQSHISVYICLQGVINICPIMSEG